MTDYTKLTEREINEAVALIKKPALKGQEFIKVDHNSVPMASGKHAIVIEQTVPPSTNILKEWFIYDPCNNPKNWAPLLEELREVGVVSIWANSVHFNSGAGGTLTGDIQESQLGKAICILWLMVKGE